MREITLKRWEDYLFQSEKFDDPKIVKVYGGGVAVTFLRTWLIRWEGELTKEVIISLRAGGHVEGCIEDITSLGRL